MSLSARRLAALAAGLALAVPLTVRAVAPAPGEQAVPAVPAPDLWQAADRDARDCRSQTGLLTQLGLSGEEALTLWNRLGAQAARGLEEGTLSLTQLELRALPNCRQALLERYDAWALANPELEAEAVVLQVNMDLDRPFYQDPEAIPLESGETDLQVLVNKYHALSPDYVPQLVPLTGLGSGSLAPEAAQAFSQMAAAAKADGISLRSKSAYRSYSTQKTIYNRNLSQYSQRFTDTFSARPGHSEHQTGLALDINSASMLDHFEDTPAYAWLQEHCAQYGFILRYPEGKDAVTGYRFEPWHYRYVGTEIASVCMAEGLTLEEYFAAQPSGWGEAPALSLGGQALTLEAAPLYLDGQWYCPARELALALGWQEEGEALVLGERRVVLAAGQPCRVDGRLLRLSPPALELEGQLWLPLPALCTALELDWEARGDCLLLTPRT